MAVFSAKWLKRLQENRIRTRVPLQKIAPHQLQLNGKTLLHFCSNDYLGLAQEPLIKKTFSALANEYGFGSAASAWVSGYSPLQQELEEKMAQFLNREQALVFSSGYLANIGILSALTQRKDTLLLDKECHASLIDGMRLSFAQHHRYPHLNMASLEQYLAKYPRSWVVTEGVFSMTGEISPLVEMFTLTQAQQAQLIVDDAHGIGVLGKKGGGVCEHFGLTANQVPLLITPLGKAFGGMGAVVAGHAHYIEDVLQFAKSYGYTTSLPPAVCGTLIKALELIEQETWRREKLQALIQYFVATAKQYHLPLTHASQTPIQCILVKDDVAVQKIQALLREKGFWVSAIRPPTVPHHTARIRISLNAFHETTHIDTLLQTLAKCWSSVL